VKVKFDAEYCAQRSLLVDLKIIWLTVLNAVRGEGISH
jgi:lipopolysaccharide/colanic/teichoic acid biosynthesis glycosyltransferase